MKEKMNERTKRERERERRGLDWIEGRIKVRGEGRKGRKRAAEGDRERGGRDAWLVILSVCTKGLSLTLRG